MRFEERKFLPKDGRTCVPGPDSPEYARATALYRMCGFIETGRRHNALKFDDGSFHDEILMYKDL